MLIDRSGATYYVPYAFYVRNLKVRVWEHNKEPLTRGRNFGSYIVRILTITITVYKLQVTLVQTCPLFLLTHKD